MVNVQNEINEIYITKDVRKLECYWSRDASYDITIFTHINVLYVLMLQYEIHKFLLTAVELVTYIDTSIKYVT